MSRGGDFPSREDFLRQGRRATVIPVCRPYLGDSLTPVSLQQLVATGDHFLLESVAGGERVARYSFVGMGFSRYFSSRGRQCRWQASPREAVVVREGDPVALLQEFLAAYHTPELPGYPSLMAQVAGWFSWERDGEFPREIQAVLPDELAVFDHALGVVWLVEMAYLETGTSREQAWEEARKRLNCWPLAAASRLPAAVPLRDPVAVSPEGAAETEPAVEMAWKALAAGDLFYAGVSHGWEAVGTFSPLDVYRVMRVLYPAPNLFSLSCGGRALVGASEETCLRLRGRHAHLTLVAGERRRRGPDEDGTLGEDLREDNQAGAAHALLLDGARSDFSRVVAGRPVVARNGEVETCAQMLYLVSELEGELAARCGPFQALDALLPAGTVAGWPKKRARDLISSWETGARGPYGGVVFCYDFRGQLSSCVVNRALGQEGGKWWGRCGLGLQAGTPLEIQRSRFFTRVSEWRRVAAWAEKLAPPAT